MKNVKAIKTLLTLALVILYTVSSYADEYTDRTTLRDKLEFRYVANPSATTYVTLDNTQIFSGTETGAFWTNSNMRRAQELVRALLRDNQNGGDATVQHYAARMIGVLNKTVRVYLYDDIAALTSAASTNWRMCLDNPSAANPKVWPCANNQSLVDDRNQEYARCMGQTVPARLDGTYAGYMHLGAHHMNSKGLSWTKGTFIHELVHTQDRSDMRLHLFWVNGANYMYGRDRTHYDIEAVPNMAMTYKEGIANTITLLYNGGRANFYFDWFSRNGNLMVEKNPNPQGTGAGTGRCVVAVNPSADAWLYNQIRTSGATEVGTAQGGTYGLFRVRDLEPKFIVHNEFILSLIFSEYTRHISFNKFMQALGASNSQLWRVSASGVAILFENMCRVGLPDGVSVDDLNRMSVAGPQKYFLPLAYADYFTGYRATSKNQFKAIFENMLPQAWVDAYWDNARQTVRTAVPMPATPQWSNLTDIAIALGITQSTPD
ncbi:MAG: hypothetical protein KDD04_01670 [Sinomicrobium sp.]|nr:hypothetical protein [Sinomicrobium sp.]